MIVRQRFDGRDHPFEGERRLVLGNVPAGAKLLRARAVVSPVLAADGAPPVETLAFAGEAWGATRVRRPAGPVAQPGWVEVDLHTRRTLHSVAGTGLAGATVEIDLGGAFAEVKHNGTLLSPGDPDEEALALAADDELLPGLTVGRFRISHATASPDVSVVRVRGVPRNVSLALGAEPAFFSAPGELTRAVTVEDFTAVLAAFLAGDEPEAGFHRVALVLRSDALGRLDVEVEIELLQQQSVLPAGLDEIVVPYAFGAMPEAAHGMLEVALPPGMRVRATEGSVVGAFAESRIVLDAGAVPPEPPSVPLAADRAQAQRLVLAERLEATAADLLLAAVSRRARLELDLLADLDGKPGGDSLLPRPAAFTLDRETAGGPTWVSVPLGVEVQLDRPEPSSWLAVKVLEGEALWFVGDAGPEAAGRLQNTTDGALSWRRSEAGGVSSPAALFRLRHVPQTFEMPIELQVGSGPAARRVSFAAQAASGRVELDLALPAIAEAFDQALAAGGAACPEGEHLDNPDFERWFALGDVLGAPESIPLDLVAAEASFVAASPNGRWAYVVGRVRNERAAFQAVDLACRRVTGTVELGSDRPVGLAVHPAGHRAYVALGGSLHVLDPVEARLLGALPVGSGSLTGLALSPDGEQVYLASIAVGNLFGASTSVRPSVEAVAAARLEAAALAGTAGDGAGLPGDPALPSAAVDGPLLDLAVSADGSRLFVLEGAGEAVEAEVTSRRLHALDAHTLAPVVDPVAAAPGAAALAASADGSLLLSLGPEGSLELRDHQTLRRLAEIEVPEGARRLALEPGGRRAFVATGQQVAVVDLERRRQAQLLEGLGTPPFDLAVTPAASHLLIATGGDGESLAALDLVPIGSPLPEEWAVTGPVRRACLDDSGSVLVLGAVPGRRRSEDGPFGLSQVAPIAPGCRYELTFEGAATVEDARLEVSWITADCRPAETVSLPVPQLSRGARSLPRVSERWTAPPEARQAEVRLRLPDGLAAVARLSLVATADALENATLQPTPGGPPAGWELAPPEAVGFTASATADGGVRLVSAAAPVTLAQSVSVVPGQLFDLTVSGGRGAGGAGGPIAAGPAAELAVSWASAAGAALGAPVALALGHAGAAPVQASGRVPEGATLARLELRLPAGASLAVERLAFALRQPQVTPAVFLAQAPGELRIRDWKVAYEPAEPARPPVPPAGLCAPTPPELEAGEECDDSTSCPRCKKAGAMRRGDAMVTAAGRTVAVESCASCGALQVRFGGRPAPRAEHFAPRPLPPLPPIQPLRPDARAVEAAPAPLALRLFEGSVRPAVGRPRPEPPLTAVVGIGEKRAAELEALGVDSIRKLAQADPDLLDGHLTGAARPLIEDLIAQARALTR